MKRREFVTLLGGAAVAWPLAARAQQSTGQPLVGLLSPLSAAAWVHILGAFRRGMRDLGYVEGANVAFTFRFADGQVAKLPALANELVALKPAVIAVNNHEMRSGAGRFDRRNSPSARSTASGRNATM